MLNGNVLIIVMKKYFNSYWLLAVNFNVSHQNLQSSLTGKANTTFCGFNPKALTEAGIDETFFLMNYFRDNKIR